MQFIGKGRVFSTWARRILIAPMFLALWSILVAASPTGWQEIVEFASQESSVNPSRLLIGNFEVLDGLSNTRQSAFGEKTVRLRRGDRIDIGTIRTQTKAHNFDTILTMQTVRLRPSLFDVGLEPSNDEVQISTVLHRKEDDRLAGVPPVLVPLVTNDGADILATAYAPTDPYHASTTPWDRLLKVDTGRFVPPMAKGDHNWLKKPLPAKVFSKQEQTCLTTAIYFEARGERIKGQVGVAQVILNRVRNPAYPGSVCEVVYQNAEWTNRCQFSFACDGIPDLINDRQSYRLARDVAMAVSGGKIFLPEVASSTHYYANYVNPKWAKAMERMTQIGSHFFLRTYDGSLG